MIEKKPSNITKRIELLLKEWNIKQKDLCEQIQISSPAISSLKRTDGVPSADTALKIANYFKVDPTWLVFGEIDFPKSYDSRPSEIYNRISKLLRKELGLDDSYDAFQNETTLVNFHGPILDYVSIADIMNWHADRSFPKTEELMQIAKHFNKTFDYIFKGYHSSKTSAKDDSNDNTFVVPKDEYNDYCRFKNYKYFVYSYDALYEPDKEYVRNLTNRLFRLRRVAENRDFDYDYMRQHPHEPPRQKDPNISDEEYEKKSKKRP